MDGPAAHADSLKKSLTAAPLPVHHGFSSRALRPSLPTTASRGESWPRPCAPIPPRTLAGLYGAQSAGQHRVARHMLHDSGAAEDVVHDAFCGALAAMRRGQDVSAAYLLVAVRRRCWRDNRAARRLEPTDPSLLDGHPCPLTEGRIENALYSRSLLERLPPRCREAVERWLAGHSYAEIASVMGVSPRTVSAQLQRAWRLLRPTIAEEEKSLR